MRTLIVTLALGLTASAAAQVQFERKAINGANLAVPVGWAVQQSAQPFPTIELSEKAGAADSPSVLIMSVPLQGNANMAAMAAEQLLRSAMPQGFTPMGQQQSPDGSILTQWQGAIGGIPARMALVHRADVAGGVGVVAAFAAPVARFDAMGGAAFLVRVLSGQPGGMAGAPASTTAPAAAPSGPLKVPAPYSASSKPVLDYLVDTLEERTPGEIAQGLRQLNPTEAQLLGVYSSFANLLHFLACRADAAVTLPNGANCAQTAQGWQQTLQLVNGDVGMATTQAQQERMSMQIAARCETGKDDPATCAAYTKTMSDMSKRNHEVMMDMIRNMDGRACTVGEPGCVPY